MNETDEILYRRFLSEGNEGDFRVLLERHRESLTLFLYGFVHSMEDAEDLILVEGGELPLDELVQADLVLSLPMRFLCREDCRGLCPVCGTNLNRCTCSCDTFVPDPRLAELQQLI